jgi:hypothetical protein
MEVVPANAVMRKKPAKLRASAIALGLLKRFDFSISIRGLPTD